MSEIQIGLSKSARPTYSLDDVALVPTRRTRDRRDVDTSWQIDAFKFDTPIIGAPMDSVMSPATAIALGKLGGLGVLNLEGLWTRYEDPQPLLDEIVELPEADPASATTRMQQIYSEPIKPELITARLEEIRDSGVVVAGSLSPQNTQEHYETVVKAGVELFVIRGASVSAEHLSTSHEPLNLKKFIYELDVPVIVGGVAGYSQAKHLMRTGAAGVLVSRLCEPSAEVGMIAAEEGRSYDDGGVRIVSSPLGRAVDTARIIARVFDIAGYPCEGPELDERLTERFYGSFEGKTYEDIASEQPEAYAQYRAQGECDLAEVERSEAVGERVRDAVLEAARACRDDQSLIVISHGSAIARGIVSLLGLDPAVFNGLRGVDNCHWSELVPVGMSTSKSAAISGWRLASHNIGSREDILGA